MWPGQTMRGLVSSSWAQHSESEESLIDFKKRRRPDLVCDCKRSLWQPGVQGLEGS